MQECMFTSWHYILFLFGFLQKEYTLWFVTYDMVFRKKVFGAVLNNILIGLSQKCYCISVDQNTNYSIVKK